jgi:hypothetical protein
MFKRLGTVYCLLLAFALLQAHNFIPHHHGAEHSIEAQHADEHDAGHHHDEEKDHDSDFPLTDLTHNADFGKVMVKPAFSKDLIEKPAFSSLLLAVIFMAPAAEPIPRAHPPDNGLSLHVIFLSHSLPLRAPPGASFLS